MISVLGRLSNQRLHRTADAAGESQSRKQTAQHGGGREECVVVLLNRFTTWSSSTQVCSLMGTWSFGLSKEYRPTTRAGLLRRTDSLWWDRLPAS